VLEILNNNNNNQQSYEIDPSKFAGENVEQNLARLMEISQKIIDVILKSANEFPMQLRILSAHLGNEVTKKFPNSRHSAVGGFLFLRFICPSILSPYQNGLLDNAILDASRSVVLITKLMQGVANGIEFNGVKEAYMMNSNTFITNNLERVRSFFDTLTTLPPTILSSHPCIASIEDVSNNDLHFIHEALVKNLPKIVKSLAHYKQKDAIPRLMLILAELGDPTGYR